MKAKHLFFILLALCVVFFFASCDDGGGSSSGGGEGRGGDVFVITDVTPHDGIDDIHTVSGGIYISSGGNEIVIKDRIELNNDGTIIDKVSAELDGIPIANSELSGTWSLNGNKYTVHLTKEKDKIEGITKDVDINASATLSADGKTLTSDQKKEGMNWYYVYTKQ